MIQILDTGFLMLDRDKKRVIIQYQVSSIEHLF